MRVMYLSAAAELGGAERSLLDVLASLARAQPSWSLRLVTAAGGPLVAEASRLGVTTAVIPFGRSLARLGEFGAGSGGHGYFGLALMMAAAAPQAAACLLGLRREIASFQPDVVHTNNLKMHLLGAWARPPRAAVVWHLHDYVAARPLTRRLLRASSARIAAVVANSDSVAEDARASLGSRVPVITVHNAVDLERFSGSGPKVDLDALARLPSTPADVVRVGLVGTFGRWKGHTTFLDAIARLPPDLPVRAYVVGGAMYQTAGSQHSLDDLKRYAADRGLGNRVGFTGFVAHPEEAMRALDIVVHASTAPEPFGLVIAEAMACGRAVIASDAGGAREVFTPGVDALVHAPGDAGALAARIMELARDPQARLRIGRAGRQTAERRFDRTRLAADLVPVYLKAAADA
jgi:glycosyltransferase involved in cell wall biosynthesis